MRNLTRCTWHCPCGHVFETEETVEWIGRGWSGYTWTHPEKCPACGAINGIKLRLIDGGTIGPDRVDDPENHPGFDVSSTADGDMHPSGTTWGEHRLETALGQQGKQI